MRRCWQVADGKRMKKLKDVLKKLVEAQGCECVGIDISLTAHASVLRVYIDIPDGVGHTECVKISKCVTDYLDGREESGEGWFPGRYLVEVSSPGLDRPLLTPEHYRRFAGKLANIILTSGKKIHGIISSCDDSGVSLDVKGSAGREVVYSRFEDIRRGNLLYVEEHASKKGDGGAGARK
jgi:ribosome maturation factor RimP